MRRSQRKPQVGGFRGGRVHCGGKPNGDQVAIFSAQSLSTGCIHWLDGSTGGEATVDSVIQQPARPQGLSSPMSSIRSQGDNEKRGKLRSEKPPSTPLP